MQLKIFLLLILISSALFAQEGNIVTDRPDQSEASGVLLPNQFQIETGFILSNDKNKLYDQRSYSYNTTILRFGVLEGFELRLGLDYLGKEVTENILGIKQSTSGFSPLYTGFKAKIAEEEGWLPQIAVLGAVVLPFTAHEEFRPEYSGGSIRFAMSNTLSERFSLGYNLGVQWDGESTYPTYAYTFTLSASIIEKLGAFVELYGFMPEGTESQQLFDGGFTYLLYPNLQLDLSAGVGLNKNATDNFISFGLSYRLPN